MKVVETWPTEQQDDSAASFPDREHVVAHLRVLTGRSPHTVHTVQARGTTIGRVGDIVVDDPRISRKHARIERAVTGWQLQDLVSRNGGYVDGRGHGVGERAPLTDGAVIRLGDTLMVFRDSPVDGDGRDDSPSFPGVSPRTVAVRRRMEALAAGVGHVLILGETGTGKEWVAKAIGEQRAPKPFVTLNSAELSRDLARAELFGYTRGAFTNAFGNKVGLVEAAGEGCIFLDEIGELPLDVQPELLRFLEDGSYRPVGAVELRHSNARVVAATHVDLDDAVTNNRFRRDLLARLRASNMPLQLPPLRERREDIPAWAQLFLARPRPGVPAITGNPWLVGALECLLLFPWPENLRQLASVVEATLQAPPPWGPEQLPAPLREHRRQLRAAPGGGESSPRVPDPDQGQIEEALRRHQGVMLAAAEQLGIHRRKLYRLCDQFGIDYESYRPESQRGEE